MATESREPGGSRTVAAIDIGSNELRMVIAEVFADGRTEVVERARRAVRLGHDTFLTGHLSQETTNAAVQVLRDYGHMLETYKVETVRAVATSAVREATNADAFLDRVARTLNLDIDVIETTEQSRLILAAVRHAVKEAVDWKSCVAMVVEVGGGSTLLTVVQHGEIAASQSYNLGSVRMQEVLSTAHEPPVRAAELLRHHVSNTVELARKSLDLQEVDTFVAIGGDARFAAQQVGDRMGETALHTVTAKQLDRLLAKCIPCTPEDLARRDGLTYADAETLVPALLVYRALLGATSTDWMIVSSVSMREGLVLDLPRYITGEPDPSLAASIERSALTIGQKYRYDEKHSEHVAELAVRIFDEMQKDHGLSPRHRLLLKVAALLHEIGTFVSNRAHHKHSYYLIVNSEILGLSREDIATAAHVARYHRRAIPRATHLEYMALPREQRMVINKLAAILRVADALDTGHWQQVRDFTMERQGNDLVIYVKGASELTLERRATADKGNLFEEIYGLKVRLEEEGPPTARAGEPGAEM
jgi:exopolyphosphatase/guanosine-5'-triphosphate,3'-diphosphate pyrophosphatase